ncbi:MAG: hypothetical protein MK193_03880 [Lentisphaeria bacterium]|nr:hypothetical protein [Lentisphaeria bacterium]
MSRLYKFPALWLADYLQSLNQLGVPMRIDPDKSMIVAEESGQVLFKLILPLSWRPIYNDFTSCEQKSFLFTMLLMEAGRASIGQFYYDLNSVTCKSHTTVRKYMVRKGQGKAQLTYLKTKGKSRYGARLRMQESKKFFEEISLKLTSSEHESSKYLFYHAPVRLFSTLEDELVTDLPFLSYSIGADCKESSFKEMLRLSTEPFYARLYVEECCVGIPDPPEYQKIKVNLKK